MNKKNEILLKTLVYSLSQMSLIEYGLVDERGIPKKIKNRDRRVDIDDSLFIYKKASEWIKHLSQKELQQNGKKINEIVFGLKDEYFMNKYLMMLFVLDHYLALNTNPIETNMMQSKVTRLIQKVKDGINSMQENHDPKSIIIDSSYLGSNIFRMLNDEAELTKEIREARVKMWKRVGQNKPKKSLEEKYSLS